ncbi:MAG: thioredoxin domain-containing protein [Chloroflexota bacterium]
MTTQAKEVSQVEGGGNVMATDADKFDEDVLKNPLPVLLDFWGPQCGPCLSLMPSVEKLAAKYAGELAVYKIESRPNWRVAVKLKVSSLPTMILFKEGEEQVRLTGDVTPVGIEQAIKEVLGV